MARAILGFWTIRRLGFLVLSLVILGATMLFHCPGLLDADYYWHLKSGEAIYLAGRILETDPFSYSVENRPWVMHEWLFQLGLYLWYRLFGHFGVLYASVFLMALAWYMAYAMADRFIQRPVVTLGLTLIFAVGMVAMHAPRPHLVSYIFYAVYFWLFIRAKYDGQHTILVAAPLIMVAWVNLHGGYALGIALMASFAGGEWMRCLFTRDRQPEDLRLCAWLTVTAFAVLLASLASPFGIEHWKYPLYISGMRILSEIPEWRSLFTFHIWPEWYLAGGLAFLVLNLFRNSRPGPTEILLPLALFIAGLMHARHMVFGPMAMLIFSGLAVRDGALANIGAALRRRPWPIPAGLQSPWTYKDTPLPPFAGLLTWCLAAWVLVIFDAVPQGNYQHNVEHLQGKPAFDFIENAGLEGNMFNEYGDGGFLMYYFHPGRKVFVDSRSALYGDKFLLKFFGVIEGRRSLEKAFPDIDIDYAILGPWHAAHRIMLASGNFAAVYSDGWRSVLVRRDGVNAEVLEQYPEINLRR